MLDGSLRSFCCQLYNFLVLGFGLKDELSEATQRDEVKQAWCFDQFLNAHIITKTFFALFIHFESVENLINISYHFSVFEIKILED